jgi:hypothetical protein
LSRSTIGGTSPRAGVKTWKFVMLTAPPLSLASLSANVLSSSVTGLKPVTRIAPPSPSSSSPSTNVRLRIVVAPTSEPERIWKLPLLTPLSVAPVSPPPSSVISCDGRS